MLRLSTILTNHYYDLLVDNRLEKIPELHFEQAFVLQITMKIVSAIATTAAKQTPAIVI